MVIVRRNSGEARRGILKVFAILGSPPHLGARSAPRMYGTMHGNSERSPGECLISGRQVSGHHRSFEARNIEHETCTLELETWDLQHGTWNLELGI